MSASSVSTALEPLHVAYTQQIGMVRAAIQLFGLPAAMVEEIALETFVMAHSRGEDLRTPALARAHLCVLALRVADSYRDEVAADAAPVSYPVPGGTVLANFLEDPRPKRREMFVLAEVGGLRVPEISAELGLSFDGVRVGLVELLRDFAAVTTGAGAEEVIANWIAACQPEPGAIAAGWQRVVARVAPDSAPPVAPTPVGAWPRPASVPLPVAGPLPVQPAVGSLLASLVEPVREEAPQVGAFVIPGTRPVQAPVPVLAGPPVLGPPVLGGPVRTPTVPPGLGRPPVLGLPPPPTLGGLPPPPVLGGLPPPPTLGGLPPPPVLGGLSAGTGAAPVVPGGAATVILPGPAPGVPYAGPGQPVAPQAVAPQPVAPQPVAPQPVAPQPVAPQPVTPQPFTPQPVAPQQFTPQPFAPQQASPFPAPGPLPPQAAPFAPQQASPFPPPGPLQQGAPVGFSPPPVAVPGGMFPGPGAEPQPFVPQQPAPFVPQQQVQPAPFAPQPIAQQPAPFGQQPLAPQPFVPQQEAPLAPQQAPLASPQQPFAPAQQQPFAPQQQQPFAPQQQQPFAPQQQQPFAPHQQQPFAPQQQQPFAPPPVAGPYGSPMAPASSGPLGAPRPPLPPPQSHSFTDEGVGELDSRADRPRMRRTSPWLFITPIVLALGAAAAWWFLVRVPVDDAGTVATVEPTVEPATTLAVPPAADTAAVPTDTAAVPTSDTAALPAADTSALPTTDTSATPPIPPDGKTPPVPPVPVPEPTKGTKVSDKPKPKPKPKPTPKPEPKPEPTPKPTPGDTTGKADPGRVIMELEMLSAAKKGLKTNPNQSLAYVNQHAKEFPTSQLTDQFDEVKIKALCALNRGAEARAETAAILKKRPTSRVAAAVKECKN